MFDCYIDGMEAYIFQHVEFEGPGAILPYLEARKFQVHLVKLHAGDLLPSPEKVDFAVLMGGPMSALTRRNIPISPWKSGSVEKCSPWKSLSSEFALGRN